MRTAPPLHYVDTENVELSSSAEQVFEIIIFAKSYRYMFSSRQISLDNNYLYMLLKRKKTLLLLKCLSKNHMNVNNSSYQW